MELERRIFNSSLLDRKYGTDLVKVYTTRKLLRNDNEHFTEVEMGIVSHHWVGNDTLTFEEKKIVSMSNRISTNCLLYYTK